MELHLSTPDTMSCAVTITRYAVVLLLWQLVYAISSKGIMLRITARR